MPYLKKGVDVFKKMDGTMKKVGHSSKGKIEAYMRALNMTSHGKMPMKKK